MDGSEPSKRAAELAAELAVTYKARLSLLHVVDVTPLERYRGLERLSRLEHQDILPNVPEVEAAEDIFETTLDQLDVVEKNEVERVIRFGHPAEELSPMFERTVLTLL